MPIKLVALYKEPENVEAFLKHYNDVHAPLVRQTPHLEGMTVDRVTGSPMGKVPYFMQVTMAFPDQARFDEAMRSPENRAAGKDLMSFAREIVTLMIVEEQ